MGTPFRGKAFHDFWATDLGDNTLPDQVAANEGVGGEVQVDRPESRWHLGHSGGGNATADAMFPVSRFLQGWHRRSCNHDIVDTKTTGQRSGPGCW